jgi:hypothetical protein
VLTDRRSGSIGGSGARAERRLAPGGCGPQPVVRLRFLNGDHHLQRTAVDLARDRELLVRFRDQNGEDPFEWYVEYSILR